jgi:hypothetical protein
MKLGLPPKLLEKLLRVLVISICKISFRFTHLMPYYVEIGRNRLTLRIPLLCKSTGASIEDCRRLLVVAPLRMIPIPLTSTGQAQVRPRRNSQLLVIYNFLVLWGQLNSLMVASQ